MKAFLDKVFPAKVASALLLAALAALLVFHVLVVAGLLPAGIVWGGIVINDRGNFYLLEGLAIAVTLVFASLVLMKAGLMPTDRARVIPTVGLWLVFGFLVLNAVGNLASGVSLENWFFAPVTLVLALIALRVALEP
jgi:hypothetical protein